MLIQKSSKRLQIIEFSSWFISAVLAWSLNKLLLVAVGLWLVLSLNIKTEAKSRSSRLAHSMPVTSHRRHYVITPRHYHHSRPFKDLTRMHEWKYLKHHELKPPKVRMMVMYEREITPMYPCDIAHIHKGWLALLVLGEQKVVAMIMKWLTASNIFFMTNFCLMNWNYCSYHHFWLHFIWISIFICFMPEVGSWCLLPFLISSIRCDTWSEVLSC